MLTTKPADPKDIEQKMIGKNHHPNNIHYWTISAVAVKKPIIDTRPVILMPEQPKAYLKMRKFDFY